MALGAPAVVEHIADIEGEDLVLAQASAEREAHDDVVTPAGGVWPVVRRRSATSRSVSVRGARAMALRRRSCRDTRFFSANHQEKAAMTLGVVKRTEAEFADWLAREWGFVSGLARFDDEPVELEPYQVAFLENRSRFRWVTKSRQVGFSFLFALEALARCHLREKHTAVFVSYNLEDAKEKILVARQVHEELPLAFQKKLVVDSKTELAFESNGAHQRLSRILSNPSKAPRGKKGDVYLDELAHYVNDREVYRGSTR